MKISSLANVYSSQRPLSLVAAMSVAIALMSVRPGRIFAAEPAGDVLQLVGTLRGIGGRQAYFSRDGSTLLTVGGDAAWVWDVGTMKPVAEGAMKHGAAIEDAGWTVNGDRVFTAGGKEVTIWDPRLVKVVGRIVQDAPVKPACVSPDGGLVVTGNEPGAGVVWDAGTGKRVYGLGGPGYLLSAQFSGDGRKLLTVTRKPGELRGNQLSRSITTVRVLDPKTGANLSPPLTREDIDSMGEDTTAAEFSPDGKTFVLPHAKSFEVVDARSGETIAECRDDESIGLHSGFARAIHFAPDGLKLMFAVDVYTRVFDPRTGGPLGKIARHHAWGRDPVVISPEGSLLFFAGFLEEASVSDARTGERLQEFGTPGSKAMAISPDGRFVAVVYAREQYTEIWKVLGK